MFQVVQVVRVFQVFHFAFGPKNRPFLVQIGTKQVFHVFRPKEKLLTKRAFVRLSLRIRPHSFSTELQLTQKLVRATEFPNVW